VERIVRVEPGFDKRHPDPAKDYGISAAKIHFLLRGEIGATQFAIYTDWYPKGLQDAIHRKDADRGWFATQPLALDLGYHSRTPRYKGQKSQGPCELLDGVPCYYDGSTGAAEPVRDAMLEEGDAAVWRALEKYYIELFGELR